MNKYYFTTEIAQLINPPLRSKYVEKYKGSLENASSTRRNDPLFRTSTTNTSGNNTEMIFGVSTAKGNPAIDLIFPSDCKILESLYSKDFTYGNLRCYDSMEPAGISTKKSDNFGEQVNELLNYNRNKHSTVILPCSYAKKMHCSHREESISNVKNIDENRRDSKVQKSREDLMEKHAVEMLWNLLKIKNHENFQDIVSAFKAYKNENSKITPRDIQKMCLKFGISAPVHVLEKLFEKCEIIDKDGKLSYEEFMHALNWKDLFPENHNFKNIKYANDWIEDKSHESKTVIDSYQTTSSFIGDHGYAVNSKIAGLPSHRRDINKSNLKGISKFKEFKNASSVIQPSAFTKYGVYEEDLNELYSKEEIKLLLRNSGIIFNDTAFDAVWQNVNENGIASIGEVWSALKYNCLYFNQY